MEVDANGFKKYLDEDLDVSLGHVVMTDVVLELGAASEVVTTVGAATLVETTSTQLGAVMDSRAITELPLHG